jgi:hypothetical protein
MYDVLRKIHLYTGFALLAFVLMYFVSGYVLIHDNFFPRSKPVETTRDEPVPASRGASPEEFSARLQQQFGLPGKRQPPQRKKDGSWKFEFFRPGLLHEVIVPPAGDRVQIKRSEFGTTQTLVGFHRLHGYGGGWPYDVWMVLFDLASFSMIVFAATGIYLWYRLTKRRALGWACLGASFTFALVTILYLVNAP